MEIGKLIWIDSSPNTHTLCAHTYLTRVCWELGGFLGAVFLWAGVLAAFPSSLSFWFALTDGSTHPVNPDCEESGESSSSGSSEQEPPGRQLFCLEYEADSGDVTSVIVYQVRLLETAAAYSPWP